MSLNPEFEPYSHGGGAQMTGCEDTMTNAQCRDQHNLAKGNTSTVEPDAAPPRDIHGVKWLLTVVAILSSTLLFSLDNTIVAVVPPSVVNNFDSIDKLPWLGAAFALGSMLILPWSKAYRVFDVKRLYCSHVILFEIGSAICGASTTMSAMILGRVIA